jgi:hypothetical protein
MLRTPCQQQPGVEFVLVLEAMVIVDVSLKPGLLDHRYMRLLKRKCPTVLPLPGHLDRRRVVLRHLKLFSLLRLVSSIDLTTGTSVWDDERGIVALRKYYALKDEAQDTVTESKRQWLDTPFSVFAVQTFQPPRHHAGMQALLEHSVQNYGPLPSELRPRRMRSQTQSRPSPYPQARISKVVASQSSFAHESSMTPTISSQAYQHQQQYHQHRTPVLQQIPINPNIAGNNSITTSNDRLFFFRAS